MLAMGKSSHHPADHCTEQRVPAPAQRMNNPCTSYCFLTRIYIDTSRTLSLSPCHWQERQLGTSIAYPNIERLHTHPFPPLHSLPAPPAQTPPHHTHPVPGTATWQLCGTANQQPTNMAKPPANEYKTEGPYVSTLAALGCMDRCPTPPPQLCDRLRRATHACLVCCLQGENPHSELLPHLMGRKGPSGFGSSTTAQQVADALDWQGAGKVRGSASWRHPSGHHMLTTQQLQGHVAATVTSHSGWLGLLAVRSM